MDRVLMYVTSNTSMLNYIYSAYFSGGISLKPSSGMDAMRADMGGAATVCSAIVTAAALNLPINIIGKCLYDSLKALILQDALRQSHFLYQQW